ncbi:hypothetical protein [Devosia sp. SD17-2]|uniref:hypothetical protein n=1 Tax=Devosia sp. SD17-2 TaxID=2976459 RepID=UPI0023D7BEFC|nr:hypothetical protein [Devosia sp. SD17-2]WEJ32180.1 hypothetical protein NYQ88_14895 [Devosia sp. SD17-2]
MSRLSRPEKAAIAEALVNEITHASAFQRDVSSFARALLKLAPPADLLVDLTIEAGRRAEWLSTPGYEYGCGCVPNIAQMLASEAAQGFRDPYVAAILSAINDRPKVTSAQQHTAQIIAFPKAH